MILITKTYIECTPESAEDGEYSDNGLIFEDVGYTFRELVREMKSHRQASNSSASGGIFEWYSSGFDTVDYVTGTDRETCIHYSRKNPERKAKYWKLAAKYAGIIK